MELITCLDNVIDEKSFLEFVKALQADKENEDRKEKKNPSGAYSSGHNGWENSTISDFLESAVAWAEDTNFGEKQDSSSKDNPWKRFAVFLYCGKIYE